MLTRAEIAAGRLDAADAAASVGERAADLLGLEIAIAHARRARGEVQLAQGDADAAAASALEAAEENAAAGAVLEEARSRLLAGEALVAAGDRDRGVEQLQEAERALGACGAERLRGEAARTLRRLGKRTRAARREAPAGEEGLASLTGREREIADLVTDRKTNREIAEELVLSEKTIESHLRNVFAKLGVTRRAELARVVEAAR